jgi:membrane-bound lytic murein transglycosylase B
MKKLLKTCCFVLFFLSVVAYANQPVSTSALEAFATEMARKHGFDRQEMLALLDQTEFREDIIQAIKRPAEAKPWHEYRKIFLKPDRIQGGVEFWQENARLLERISSEYGVPPEIIVAIIGVETRFGEYTGRYRVLDALTTLAFGYPRRAKFFRSELEQFILLSREENVDPRQTMGSYAGAMGMPQFISSSYRRYAVDHDGDGHRDLWNNNADVIASVANYFKVHGWRQGQLITLQMEGGRDLDRYVAAGMKPSIKVADLLARGMQPRGNSQPDPEALTSLIQLDAGDDQEYWLGLHNFYVITRYNHSNLYAMAAYQLSQEIRAAKQASEAAKM